MIFVILGCLFQIYYPIVYDSTIYGIDVETTEALRLTLNDAIIDYKDSDFLYVLTDRYLWKIDNQNLTVIDHIPLPMRFNYLLTDVDDIILFSTGEIVFLDKNSLSFKSGIGIEFWDYKPIFQKDYFIYLITNIDSKSVIDVYDIKKSKRIKRLNVSKILSYKYDSHRNTLITFDIGNNINIYDNNLRKKGNIKLKFSGRSFACQGNGYLVYNPQGVFLNNHNGVIVDFQPVPIKENNWQTLYVFLTDEGIVYLDSLTIRPKWLYSYVKGVLRLEELDNLYSIIIDSTHCLYILGSDSLQMKLLAVKEALRRETISSKTITDSLWYLQLGAFSNSENAKIAYKDLRKRDIPVFIDSTDLYRIKFGGFLEKELGFKMMQKLDINGWFVFQKKFRNESQAEFNVGDEKYILKDGIIKRE